jgi:F420-0:gamma-glutamyl ligase-like protein
VTDTEIEWRDPPPHGGNYAWEERLAPLKERPGQWAMVWPGDSKDAARNTANYVRRRYGVGLEVVVRGREVFARYVGG